MPADLSMTHHSGTKRARGVPGGDRHAPDAARAPKGDAPPTRRGLFALNRSPLARKIILSNVLAMVVLLVGVIHLDPFRDSLVAQRDGALAVEAQLVARILELGFSDGATAPALGSAGQDLQRVVDRLSLPVGADIHVFALPDRLIASTETGSPSPAGREPGHDTHPQASSPISAVLRGLWSGLSAPFGTDQAAAPPASGAALARTLIAPARDGQTVTGHQTGPSGTVHAAASPIFAASGQIGVVALTTRAGAIDQLVQAERQRLLRMFAIALIVSIGLSLVLAATIANPLADLAAAAELGRDTNTRKTSATPVRIPDLTGRPDEIGRLSGALRGMVSALHDLIDRNEQFAADVSHEIKNPLASLRSAVGTLRRASTDDQRNRLLEVIEHDVQRLDRLVTDIANASRLDSELVREEKAEFDLGRTLRNIARHHTEECDGKGVDFIADLPDDPIRMSGLEGRLAQVLVNLVSNAISFCHDGDAVRLWVRRRDNRVLIVVEDSGPGIPEEALTKVFDRFYSERPADQFGKHSGLGLAISKQIVEAHDGVIWAENIRPAGADATAAPRGARFVVGLPV